MKHLMTFSFAAFMLFAVEQATAKPSQLCLYTGDGGAIRQTNSLDDVPAKFRAQAKCFSASQNQTLAKPEDIQLKGNIRRENISTPLGKVEMRWPRTVESLFGRTPLRALTDAATTVSRAVRTASFPNSVQDMNISWQVVFMDENLPEMQIPQNLISNCHPGWMTPPGNIYIVAQRVAAGCGGAAPMRTSVADSELAQVLIHEMGHAVEYQMLQRQFSGDRMRAEGFATWFQIYASEYSSIVNPRKVKELITNLARMGSKSGSTFNFSGSAEDYGRAAMYFMAISDKRGVRGIIDVYKAMAERGLSFFEAVKRELNWNQQQLEDEARRAMNR